MSGNSRSLNFTSSDLGRDVNLLLMFEPPKNGTLYKDLFPVCWKVLKFTPSGISAARVEYTADSGLLVPQRDTGNLVAASNAQRCQTGQMCVMETNDEGDNFLNPAVAGDPGVILCEFKTHRPSEVAFGLFNKAGNKIEPVMKWDGVGVGSTLAVQLTPKLRIYGMTDYQETELVRGEIRSPLLFEENLIALPNFTEWIVSIDPASNAIKINRS
ncbi:hypothetical protein JR316_0012719 [Psilocybe cubensis]|uniref:Uncharacterized protein n=2 Tax=Psilocybe cubensis TaxID=181762 RepID=A0ACB8GJN5_PSICU|nr:hypothetical protein JR316_0012719 [Psilocybe cubensis]KAH9475602.1 hypothetical protein JR316_0012719 [Psilocybe cubensis]